MKYKAVGIISCIALLFVSAVPSLINAKEKPRFHQHSMSEEKKPCSHGDDEFCSHLPIVKIDTDGEEIPGKAIEDENSVLLGYTSSADGGDRINARIRIIDNTETNNHFEDSPAIESGITIHVRGNSSRRFDKSSYAVKLLTDTGENNPQPVMGMDAHHEWVMHGPFLDKTLIRNYMWYNIAGEIMEYSPDVRFCEAFLNGEYQGLYVMTEKITAGQDGARLQLTVNKKKNTYTGYLLCMDRPFEESLKNADTFTKYSMRRNENDLEIVYPGKDNLTPEISRSIAQDFSDFEKALYSYDYDNDEYGYEDFIDVDSFADYFILNEITCNYDAGRYSTYIYKDIHKKYKMCIWDFNNSCDAYQETQMPRDGFMIQQRIWYDMIMKDEDFNKRVIRRYRELRRGILSDESLESYIDDTIGYLGDAIDRNYEKWGYSFEQEHDLLYPSDRNPHSFEESVNDMKQFLKERCRNMDENIDTILQYSAESKVKKFNENAN